MEDKKEDEEEEESDDSDSGDDQSLIKVCHLKYYIGPGAWTYIPAYTCTYLHIYIYIGTYRRTWCI